MMGSINMTPLFEPCSVETAPAYFNAHQQINLHGSNSNLKQDVNAL